jgi:hypothetical protein
VSALIAIESAESRLQSLAWRALERFVAIRRLRRSGIEALGEKCSSVQLEDWRDGDLPPGVLEVAMRRLAQGVPAGATVSICPFTKPPPVDLSVNEIAPQAAVVVASGIASMQVLCAFNAIASAHIYRFAVTWNPRPPRQRRIAHESVS